MRAAATRIRSSDVVSHESACAVLGLPVVGDWPSKVHVADPSTPHTRVTAWFVRHGVARRPATEHRTRCFSVTTPARTAVDLAAGRPLLTALPVIDAVLRGSPAAAAAMTAEYEQLEHGQAKVALALRMGSAASGSAAESVFRVRLRQLGAPEPAQQHVFDRPGERRAIVDFWFAEQGVVVEVDGRVKYEDPTMLGGRTTAEAHWQEKRREDFVRSFPQVRTVVRVTWADLMDLDRLRVKLVRAGVPCR